METSHSQLSPQLAHDWCCWNTLALLPRNFVFFGHAPCSVWILPSVYVTVKSKRFSDFRRICTKHGHACIRKVISFSRWPKKRCWRMISRGLQLALQKGCHSWQVWRMKNAPAVLKTKIGQVVHSHDPFCWARCGREKLRMVATVHDAGQFFECLGVEEALSAAARVLDLAQSITGYFYASVFRREKKAGFLSNMPYPACARKFICFSFSELFLCFSAAITFVHVWSVPMSCSWLRCL